MARQMRRLASRKIKRKTPRGVIHVQASFNNTIVTITNPAGGVMAWSSSGACGFKGAKKGTPFAAQIATEVALRTSMDHGLRQVGVIVRGPGSGREAAIRALQAAGISITMIRDSTSVPHNGCRPPKKRRV
jgi:small subunit ribosomal protein S11